MKKKKSSLQVWRQVFARGVRLGAKGVNWLAPEVHISWGGRGHVPPRDLKDYISCVLKGVHCFGAKSNMTVFQWPPDMSRLSLSRTIANPC